MPPKGTLVHNIPDKMQTTWLNDSKAILDTWITYDVDLASFRCAVLDSAVPHLRQQHGVAYIVDSSEASGGFSDEIQTFIGAEVFRAFSAAGIKYFITVTSKVSILAKITVAEYSAKAGPWGLTLVEVNSVEDAEAWLKQHA